VESRYLLGLGLGLGLGLWVNSNRVSLYVCKFVSCKSVVCNRKLSNLCVRELMLKAVRGNAVNC